MLPPSVSSSKPLLRDMSPPSCRLQAAAAAALVKADEAAVEKTVAAVIVSVPFAAGVLSGLGYIETLAPNCFMFAPDQTFGNFGASISGDWRNLCISKTPMYGLRDLEIVKCSVGLLYSKALFLLVTGFKLHKIILKLFFCTKISTALVLCLRKYKRRSKRHRHNIIAGVTTLVNPLA